MQRDKFNWLGASKENAAIELKRRNRVRHCRGNPSGKCVVCGEGARPGQAVYFPSASISAQNRVLGHVYCVDRAVAQVEAVNQGVKAAAARASNVTPIRSEDTRAISALPDADLHKRALIAETRWETAKWLIEMLLAHKHI